MMKTYRHSAYWYAYHEGKTFSESQTYAEFYIDQHRRPGRWVEKTTLFGKKKRVWQKPELYDNFNPLIFAAFILMDIGVAMREEARRMADPDERAKMENDLKRDLRIARRPFYYAQETARRRQLAIERRQIKRRRTLSPMPTPEQVLEAWIVRNDSKENMIRLGGMIHDLECYVDNGLRFDDRGDVVGRNGGIKGWIAENLPELNGKYKSLMRYKAMAIKLRQATGIKDPTPTARLLEKPRPRFVRELCDETRIGFSVMEKAIEFRLHPETVLKRREEHETEIRVWEKRLHPSRARRKAAAEARSRSAILRGKSASAVGGSGRLKKPKAEGKRVVGENENSMRNKFTGIGKCGNLKLKAAVVMENCGNHELRAAVGRKAGGNFGVSLAAGEGKREGGRARTMTKRQRERVEMEAALDDLRFRRGLSELRVGDFS